MLVDYTKADKKTLETSQIAISARNEKIEEFLVNQRDLMNKSLEPLYERLKDNDPKKLISIQAEALSLRQKITDDITVYLSKLSKETPALKNAKSSRILYYVFGYGLKTTSQQQTILIDSDLAENTRHFEILSNFIEYLRECKYSCDQISFAVKNRIELLKWQTSNG